VIVQAVHEPSGDQTAFEATIMKNLKHDAIIQLVDVFPTDEGPALALPLAVGGDLLCIVERHEFRKESDAKIVMFSLLSALAYCHRNGVWHRDVKLENLFLMTVSLDSVMAIVGVPLIFHASVRQKCGRE
jgi:serine/threonine protein kinase